MSRTLYFQYCNHVIDCSVQLGVEIVKLLYVLAWSVCVE